MFNDNQLIFEIKS